MQKTASKQYMFMYSGIQEERSPRKSWKVVLEVVFGEGFFYVQRWTEGFAETWYSKLMMLKSLFLFCFCVEFWKWLLFDEGGLSGLNYE